MNVYVHDMPDGTKSKPEDLYATIEAAHNRIDAGKGPFVVLWANKRRSGLTAQQALGVLNQQLPQTRIGEDIHVRQGDGSLCFHVARVSLARNPFRDVRNFVAGRVDDGVDATGVGPVYPLASGEITLMGAGAGSRHVSTWSMDTFFVVKYTEPPFTGMFDYTAESVRRPAGLKVGDKVDDNTVIAFMNGGGIERGWANPPGTVDSSIAHPGGSGTGVGGKQGDATCYGVNYMKLLEQLGCKGFTVETAVLGHLPANWPTDWAKLL